MPRPIKTQPMVSGLAPLRLDWRAYFHEFCRIHGEPILWRGRLLFRDGWTYSATDYKGPEWRPPEEPKELAKLVVIYYKHRLTLLKRIHRDLQDRIEWLDQAQSLRDIPLQHRVLITDDDGLKRITSQQLPLEEYRHHLTWLESDLENCKATLAQAESALQGDNHVST